MAARRNGDSTEATLDEAAARWIWGAAWAREAEEVGRERELGIGPGVNIMDVMPPVPQAAYDDARAILDAIADKNENVAASVKGADLGSTLYGLTMAAVQADMAERPPNIRYDAEKPWSPDFDPEFYLRRFVETLAAQSTGEGIAWTDDHADIGLEIPVDEPTATMDAAREAVDPENKAGDPAP